MKRRDIWLLAGVMILAAAIFLLAKVLPEGSIDLSGAKLPVTTAPADAEINEAITATPLATGSAQALAPANAYLSVQMDRVVFDPFPLVDSRDFELPQPDGKLNVVRATEDSIIMLSSTCDNQDCVHQGIVTLDNRNARVLDNAIICLPNKVILTLLTPDEAQREWDRHNAP